MSTAAVTARLSRRRLTSGCDTPIRPAYTLVASSSSATDPPGWAQAASAMTETVVPFAFRVC